MILNSTFKYIIGFALVLILIAFIIVFLFYKRSEKERNKKYIIRKMAMIGILSALSVILYFIKFPLPFFVSFLEIQFSNIPVLIGSFMFGPIEGIMIALVRTIVKIPFSHTLCVGELQDLLISSTISCITSLFYFKNKTKKGAAIALVLASLAWTAIAVLTNAFVSIPIYIKFMFNGNDEVLINMISSVIPNVTADNYLIKYLLLSCLPFNILLSSLVSVITFLVYKKTSNLFKKISERDDNSYEEQNS